MQVINLRTLNTIKTASEALDYVKSVKPQPGKTYILVLAMTAHEFYGPNRNGDSFCEKPVPGLIEEGDTLVDCYKTFESAGIYEHHKNKDPSKSLGKVVKAFYNFDMHRVELLLELDNSKASHIIEKINNGEYPAVSMGCKIKWDICARKGCWNKAPKQDDYCEHARNLGQIDAVTGEANHVLNPCPQLFDISFVLRNADKVAFMMKKVATHTNKPTVVSSADLAVKIADINKKIATLKKLSDMNKLIQGQVVASNPPPTKDKNFVENILPKSLESSSQLPDSAIEEIAKHPLPEGLSTLDEAGIHPNTIEITKIIVRRAGGPKIPDNVLDKMPAFQDKIFALLQKLPELLSSLEKTDLVKVSSELVNRDLLVKMLPYMEKRSNVGDYLYRRTIGDVSPEQGYMEPRMVETPTGEAYTTTRKAVETAQDANLERDAKILAGTGLLSGTLYKILSSSRLGKAFSPLLLGGSIFGAKKVHDEFKVPNLPGTDVPVNTELHKVSHLTDASIYSMLAQEHLQTKPVKIASTKQFTKTASLKPQTKFASILLNINDSTSEYELQESLAPWLKVANEDPMLVEYELEPILYALGDALWHC